MALEYLVFDHDKVVDRIEPVIAQCRGRGGYGIADERYDVRGVDGCADHRVDLAIEQHLAELLA